MNTTHIPQILVVEDNAIYRKLLGTMIERITGALPHTASDGEEALRLCRHCHYDLIFMDNHMPVLGGIATTRKIRESKPASDQPMIVAVTGSSDRRDLDQFSDAGIDALLAKPFGMRGLERCIHTVLQPSTAMVESRQ